MSEDPQFYSPEEGGTVGDAAAAPLSATNVSAFSSLSAYRLKPSSPIIDQGLNLGPWLENGQSDINGTTIKTLSGVDSPQGANYDIGASESLSNMFAPWVDSNIGNPLPMPPGSASYDSSTHGYSITGGGSDIWGNSDSFNFLYEPLSGDGTIVAKLATFAQDGAKAGIMIRSSLADGAANAFLTIQAGTGGYTQFQYRASDGGLSFDAGSVSTTSAVQLELVRIGSTITAYTSPDDITWTQLGLANVIMGDTVYVGMAVSGHGRGSSTAIFKQFSVTPSSWVNSNIGSTIYGFSNETSGYVGGYSTNTYTVQASGADIWGVADQFQYDYTTLTGDGSIIARITGVPNQDGLANDSKAGLMIRNSVSDPGSANAYLCFLSSGIAQFQYRALSGANSQIGNDSSIVFGLPYWLKLSRAGQSLSGYYSADGVKWTLLSTENISMNSTVYIGLAATSHNADSLTYSTYQAVSIVAGPWSFQDINNPGMPGSASFAGSSASIQSSGLDTWNYNQSYYPPDANGAAWNTADEFSFLYQPINTFRTFITQVTSFTDMVDSPKAGLMLRVIDPSSPIDDGADVFVAMSPNGYSSGQTGAFMNVRSQSGYSFDSYQGPVVASTGNWVKLTISGTGPYYVVQGALSTDGVNWTTISSASINISNLSLAYVGLAVTAHKRSAVDTSTFANISMY